MRTPTTKVAFAAYLHDLGKFAERARIEVNQEKLETHIQLYCPYYQEANSPIKYHTHKHAAYSAIAWDIIEHAIPDLIKGDMYPFASRSTEGNITDSIINASAMHHKPETFLQWVIATADRVASGFEREEFEKYNQTPETELINKLNTGKNHYQARLLPLVEKLSLLDKQDFYQNEDIRYCYPLKPLSPQSIFPEQRKNIEPSDNARAQQEYRQLWDAFTQAIKQIPKSHQQNWQLWLDHFDTLWQCYAQAIPAATAFNVKPEVSLYDHSKTTAALAAALWRWHEEHQKTSLEDVNALKTRSDWEEKKILLIHGDFFGIQNFIFAEGRETNKAVAKLLRGRSFQVSLFAELAALAVLEACDLPSTSQILNAAGKFMIVAPNTPATIQAIEKAKEKINQWFLENTFAQVSLGLAVQPASCNDFVDKKRFADLTKNSFSLLEQAKLQRFNLIDKATPTVLSYADYTQGVCSYNSQLPANTKDNNGLQVSVLANDQIKLGEQLTKKNRLMILNDIIQYQDGGASVRLGLTIFGYHIVLTKSEDITGKFGLLAENKSLVRCWDFSLPQIDDVSIWQGYAKRYINAYVPTFSEADFYQNEKYDVLSEEEKVDFSISELKTLNHIACEDRYVDKQHIEGDGYEKMLGKVALATLKGDVDNLGLIFQRGIQSPTFAKMAALSRQMNMFFSLYLPAYCQKEFPNTYTVFAGGDDFFMIGPWKQTQKLAVNMRRAFAHYMAENPQITFSTGISITKPGMPLPRLSELAEDSLEQAKAYEGKDSTTQQISKKNAVCIYQQTVSWSDWKYIENAYQEITEIDDDYVLSSAYLYSLLHFSRMAEQVKQGNIQASLWHSQLAIRRGDG
ncbi:CRISPR-associated protein Csm1 [Pelistega indica]|uniref:CRISPR system single-strand-specific deoxyribonuclease Cas10/Csm1 (subtype III-A) n=1 Tax=Pelistega indica TaxID=1414851 RepID=V8G9V4_9BURK|nr:type III-A CRISPR-associated protein Cas10/Csm1 [Pelistega indica]ETD72728.1 CRISPR-associated protein Csm1 [Pelistega indica]